MGNNILKFVILAVILYQCAVSIPLNLHSFNAEQIKETLASNTNVSLTCDVCRLLVSGIRLLIEQNKTDQELDKFAIDTCINFKIEQPYVCKMIVEEFGDEIYFVLEHSFLEPHEFCSMFVSDCGPVENPFDQPWPLQIPGGKPEVKPWPIPENGKPTMRVLHLADIHIDRQYSVGSEADCTNGEEVNTYAFCCRDYPPEKRASQKDVTNPAGQFGMPMKCDIPFVTFDLAMQQISQQEKFDYIIITGDLEPHAIWDYTKETTTENIVNITDTILKYFPYTPVFQAVGNHEGVPMDAFAPHHIKEYDTRGPQWLYTVLNQQWGHWLPTAVQESLQFRGSYAFKPFNGLKMISLNTVYCSKWNFYLYINATDPDDTLEWLAGELLDSEKAGEKVHIISHIPSGDSYCLKAWAANYYQLVNRFENTIAAQFFGHTHNDHFYMYYEDADPKGKPSHVAFIAPSLTTYSDLNPAYRVYTIDGNYEGSTFTVLDEDNYWVNITEANIKGELKFELEYNKKKEFGMKDLSPASFNDLLQRMLTDESLLDKYITYFYRNNAQLANCDAKCKKDFICNAMTGEAGKEDIFCAGIY